MGESGFTTTTTKAILQEVLIDVRGADGADLLCADSAGGLAPAESRAWLGGKLQQARSLEGGLTNYTNWIAEQEASQGAYGGRPWRGCAHCCWNPR